MIPNFDSSQEVTRIVKFLKESLEKTSYENYIVACSGGIDSSVSLTLATKAVDPEHIFALLLPYGTQNGIGSQHATQMLDFMEIPKEQCEVIDIKPVVDEIIQILHVGDDKVRRGNLMARVRMIMLFDRAKKQRALVCGTENKSEKYLGYFTRFGDQASDIEPLQHLYKTQVYILADELKLPREIISQHPTAGLWEGQTDEKELGFTYKEADEVIHLLIDEGLTEDEILAKNNLHAKEIITRVKTNSYKHHVPYVID